MPDWSVLTSQLATHLQTELGSPQVAAVGGGCINAAYRLSFGPSSLAAYFVKLNAREYQDMFQAEAAGLSEILAAGSITVPAPILCGVAGDEAFLVLEYLPLRGGGNAAQLGEQLAALHRTQAPQFGWWRDNTIGSTAQINTRDTDWVRFWQRHRLGYQLALAAQNGASRQVVQRGERLLADIGLLFRDYQPVASLLHGDLWGGNVGYLADGAPVIFDPAVYYGDRETDLAMSELFGGFPAEFYRAYNASWPLDEGYRLRKTLYNLYHILNHFNLFGGGYLHQAMDMIDRLRAELG